MSILSNSQIQVQVVKVPPTPKQKQRKTLTFSSSSSQTQITYQNVDASIRGQVLGPANTLADIHKVFDDAKVEAGLPTNTLVIGGTHGDEMPGIRVVEKLLTNPTPRCSPVYVELGNKTAIAMNKRFTDKDMNRISKSDAQSSSTLDEKRAKELYEKYEYSPSRMVVDLHTTTSNAGVMLIAIEDSGFKHNINLAKHINACLNIEVNVFSPKIPEGTEPKNLMPNMSNKHLAVELGPVMHGQDDAVAANTMMDIVNIVTEYVDSGVLIGQDTPIPTYVPKGVIELPEGYEVAPDFMGTDYKELSHDTVVLTNGTKTIAAKDCVPEALQEKLMLGQLHPVFIGEAAYKNETPRKACILCVKEDS